MDYGTRRTMSDLVSRVHPGDLVSVGRLYKTKYMCYNPNKKLRNGRKNF